MVKFFYLILAISLSFAGCAQKENGAKLKEGTPAYQMAMDISAKVPIMDPIKNNILVSAKKFKVTAGDVAEILQANLGGQAAQIVRLDTARLKNFVKNSAEQLGLQHLMLSAAKDLGVTVADKEVDSLFSQQVKRAGSKEKFNQFLESKGIALEKVMTDMRNSLVIQRYLDSMFAKLPEIGENEIKKAYDEDKTATVRHILLLTKGKSDSAKKAIRKKMDGILKRARTGEDFAKLATEFSEDPGSKKTGGLYKDFPKGRMVKAFEDSAFGVPVGKISGIIETKYGLHILKVINRKKETRTLAEARKNIISQLKRSAKAHAYETLIEGLKKKAEYKAVDI